MPTLITHGLVGLAGAASCSGHARSQTAFWVLSAVVPMLPDVDALAFKFGVPYGAAFGHRGMSHSILWAAAIGAGAAWFMVRTNNRRASSYFRWSAFFFLLALTHPLLDACTDGGLGVAFFSPFIDQRFFFPFRPIRAAPLSISRFFSASAVPVIMSEALWVWIPAVVCVLSWRLLRRSGKNVDALPPETHR